MKNNRLAIAGVVFALLLGGAVFALQGRDAPQEGSETAEEPTLPEIEQEAITRLVITRPGAEGEDPTEVTLERRDDAWVVTSPVEAETDEGAVTTALEKLGDLELTGVAATREENHERLEVADNGIRIAVYQGDGDPIELIIGAYRGRNTMVRLAGEAQVLQVAGSIKYAFNKDVDDWRNKRVLNLPADRIGRIEFENEGGHFLFTRNDGEWAHELAEGEEAIERFSSSKVQSIVSSIAGMRAVGFAADDAEVASLGFGTNGRVQLWLRPEEEETDEAAEDTDEAAEDTAGDATDEAEETAPALEAGPVIELGAETDTAGERYVRVEGNPVVYVISRYLAERIAADTEKFQNPEPGAEPATPEMPPMGGLGGMGGPGGPGGGQIPPELMQQIQQQLQAQGAQ